MLNFTKWKYVDMVSKDNWKFCCSFVLFWNFEILFTNGKKTDFFALCQVCCIKIHILSITCWLLNRFQWFQRFLKTIFSYSDEVSKTKNIIFLNRPFKCTYIQGQPPPPPLPLKIVHHSLSRSKSSF